MYVHGVNKRKQNQKGKTYYSFTYKTKNTLQFNKYSKGNTITVAVL